MAICAAAVSTVPSLGGRLARGDAAQISATSPAKASIDTSATVLGTSVVCGVDRVAVVMGAGVVVEEVVAGVVTPAAAVVGGGESAVVVGSLLQAVITRLQAKPAAVSARTDREWYIGCSFEVTTGGTRRRSHRRHALVAALQQR